FRRVLFRSNHNLRTFVVQFSFVRGEIEDAVLLDWTACSSSQLLCLERRNYLREVVGLIERVIAPKVERISVKIIASRFGYDIDGARGRTPKFRRVRVGHHLKFLNCFLSNRSPSGGRNIRTSSGNLIIEVHTFQPYGLKGFTHTSE